jgi:hypothetical protein
MKAAEQHLTEECPNLVNELDDFYYSCVLHAMQSYLSQHVKEELEWLQPILTASHPDLQPYIQARITQLKELKNGK